ncbi:MAG: hypothetical protein IRY99_03080 [Isosphaeraceae bacterium]|nr:hypothetical protein [Isosphaeraceae bacterium]
MSSSSSFASTSASADVSLTTSAEGSPVPISYRDWDGLAAIIGALQATGEFAEVLFAAPLDGNPVGADRVPLALVAPTEWAEAHASDLTSIIRRVVFTITLVVRESDALARFQQLDRLTAVVQNAISGATLGGGCLGSQTRISAGRYDTQSHYPGQRAVLRGEFCYLIPSDTGRDTTP